MRSLRTSIAAGVVLLLAILYCGAESRADQTPAKPANATLVYVGTHTGAKSKGIYLFWLQTSNLEVSQNITLVPLGLAAETPNPVFIELDPKRRLLFAVNEIDQFEGKPTGSVSAFSIDPSGKLTLLNQRASRGAGPCHMSLDKDMRNVLVANCGSGTVAVLPIGADGRLGEATDVVTPAGKESKIRGITIDPASHFAFTSDMASDKVMTYRFDAQQGKLSASEPSFTQVKTSAGPRRMVFRPDGKFAYVVNEQNSTLVAFAYNSAAGSLKELQTISTVPEYYDGPNAAAEIGMHPSGKYLYVSNRGHNSVVLFSIEPEKGTLAYVEEQGTGGSNPVSFGIQPSAQHLAIVNHDADTVLASRIDAGNGRLKPSGIFATVASPACVRFLPPPESGR